MPLFIKNKVGFLIVFVLVLFASLEVSAATPPPPPSVKIIAPLDGTVVVPGQSVQVEIQTTVGINSAIITVEKPLTTPKDTKSPKKFVLTVPPRIAEGTYRIKAMTESNGLYIESNYVNLVVKWPLDPDQIVIEPEQVSLGGIGGIEQLKVLGKFSNDDITDITTDPETIYSSSNPTIATVTPDGVVAGLSAGTAVISVVNGLAKGSSAVNVASSRSTIKYDVRLEVHAFTEDKDGNVMCNLSLINNSTVPLSVIELEEVTLDDKKSESLPPMKLGFGKKEEWLVTIPFKGYVDHPGLKAVLHIEGVYSPTPQGFYDPRDFKFDADIAMP